MLGLEDSDLAHSLSALITLVIADLWWKQAIWQKASGTAAVSRRRWPGSRS